MSKQDCSELQCSNFDSIVLKDKMSQVRFPPSLHSNIVENSD